MAELAQLHDQLHRDPRRNDTNFPGQFGRIRHVDGDNGKRGIRSRKTTEP